MKWIDPIVQEVREAREELARQANYDLHTFFENLRQKKKIRKVRINAKSIKKNKVIKPF